MQHRVFIFAHVFVRFLSDFGNVINFLNRENFKVKILTSPPNETNELSAYSTSMIKEYLSLLPAGAEMSFLPVESTRVSFLSVIKTALVAFRVGLRNADGLYILWGTKISIACGLPLRLLNRRCLFMVTGLGTLMGSKDPRLVKEVRFGRSLAMSAYRFLLTGKNSRCLTHNEEDKEYLSMTFGVDPKHFFVTPGCGVDPKVFPFFSHYMSHTSKVILVPARLIEEKGIFEAAAASKILDARGIAHEMWFTGAVEPYPKSEVVRTEGCSAIREEDIERMKAESPSIKFIGYNRSVVPLYEQCDIVCLPSRYPEGLPTALIEAAACGRPAVTCDNVGCREIVVHGETGLVVPKADAVALAAALERLLTDEALCERFRQAAYQRFLAGYTKDIVLQRTVEGLESLGFSFEAERSAPDIRVAQAA
jgi:glycosyltransferase involved in cell wall biosynthesis